MSNDTSNNHKISNDNASNLLFDNKDIICPVCKEVFVFPRIYECGHTICELCMYEMDRRDCPDDTHTALVHHCPVCRHPTLQSWQNRPISILLESISSKHPNYNKRKLEVMTERRERKGTFLSIPEDVNLADLSHTSRLQIALGLYEILVEHLYKAANEGLCYLVIKDKNTVKEIEKVVDMLSVQLFSKHNVYKIIVTRNECTIYIHKDAFSWGRQHTNRNWTIPGPSIPGDPTTIEEEPPENATATSYTSVLSALLANGPPGLPPLSPPHNPPPPR